MKLACRGGEDIASPAMIRLHKEIFALDKNLVEWENPKPPVAPPVETAERITVIRAPTKIANTQEWLETCRPKAADVRVPVHRLVLLKKLEAHSATLLPHQKKEFDPLFADLLLILSQPVDAAPKEAKPKDLKPKDDGPAVSAADEAVHRRIQQVKDQFPGWGAGPVSDR